MSPAPLTIAVCGAPSGPSYATNATRRSSAAVVENAAVVIASLPSTAIVTSLPITFGGWLLSTVAVTDADVQTYRAETLPQAGEAYQLTLGGYRQRRTPWAQVVLSQGTYSDLVEEYVLVDATDRSALREELARLGHPANGGPPFKVQLNGHTVHSILRSIETPLSVVKTHTPSLEDAYLEIVSRTSE